MLSSWLRHGLGQTISQIVSVFDSLFHFPVSGGGLTRLWQRLGAIMEPWRDGLAQEARKGAALNAREWTTFRAILKRILKDAIRLSRRADREARDYKSKAARIHKRVDKLLACDTWSKQACKRVRKRLIKFRDSLFTLLDDPSVPFDNNRAEREIRPAVIARKNSFHNTSEKGADTQAVLMSVYRALKLRGLDPIETIADAPGIFIATGKLPSLPTAKPPG